MSKFCFNAEKAPSAIGPYAHAVVTGGFVFLSGQLGIDPSTNALVPGGVVVETRQALSNICAILAELGLSPSDVVKTTVFLRDMRDFSPMNTVYGEIFSKDFPARSAVQVAALPKNGEVEIEVVANAQSLQTERAAFRRVGD
jgi:2-iminobutanoate/2-iminopropanoate deaminase